ncbi:hypothetical protein EBQ81_02845 [bacterium]|nr:hypothetical protein [bacterium]
MKKTYTHTSKSATDNGLNKKRWLIIGTVVIGIIIVFLYLESSNRTNFFGKTTVNQKKDTTYSPPTDQEKKAGDEQKQKITGDNPKPAPQNNTSNQPKKTVTVLITDAAQYDSAIEVRSFIPDFYEDGTCTILFTKDTLSFTKTAPAFKDSSTTICTNPVIKRSEFKESGTWIVSVSYESANAIGQSQSQSITIK